MRMGVFGAVLGGVYTGRRVSFGFWEWVGRFCTP